MQRFLPVAVLFGCLALSAHGARADMAIAIGLTDDPFHDGWIWGGGFGDGRRQQALNICRGFETPEVGVMPTGVSKVQKLCKIVEDFSDKCFAIASDSDDAKKAATGVGWAVEGNMRSAQAKALLKCEAMVKSGREAPCAVSYSHCDGSAQ
jgi:hypothetical protein